MTNTTTTMSAIEAINAYNALILSNAPATKLTEAENTVVESVKAENKTAKDACVEELLTIYAEQGKVAFFDAYLANRTYTGISTSKSKEDGTYDMPKPHTFMLGFRDLEKGYKAKHADNIAATLARDGRYKAFVELLQWNLAREVSKEIEVSKEKKTGKKQEDKQVLTDKKLEAMAKDPKLEVFKGCTNGALLSQMQYIVDSILPEDYPAVKLNSADRRYVQLAAVQKVKRGVVTGSKDTVVLEELITAIVYRKAGAYYEFQSKSAGMRNHNNTPKLTAKQEQIIANTREPVPSSAQAEKNARKEAKAAAEAAKTTKTADETAA